MWGRRWARATAVCPSSRPPPTVAQRHARVRAAQACVPHARAKLQGARVGLHCMHADSEGAGGLQIFVCRRGLSVRACTRRRPEGLSSAGVGVYVYGANEYFRNRWERIRIQGPACLAARELGARSTRPFVRFLAGLQPAAHCRGRRTLVRVLNPTHPGTPHGLLATGTDRGHSTVSSPFSFSPFPLFFLPPPFKSAPKLYSLLCYTVMNTGIGYDTYRIHGYTLF